MNSGDFLWDSRHPEASFREVTMWLATGAIYDLTKLDRIDWDKMNVSGNFPANESLKLYNKFSGLVDGLLSWERVESVVLFRFEKAPSKLIEIAYMHNWAIRGLPDGLYPKRKD